MAQPLLTEDAFSSSFGDRPDSECSLEPGSEKSALEGLRQTDLGGCCCDCCHTHGCNFGRKFPNLPSSNQFLTPQCFSSLCRLGHHSAREAVEAVAASCACASAGVAMPSANASTAH